MKNGKYIPLGYYQNIKIGYGTVDYKDLKTIYIKLNSWVLPDRKEDYSKIISFTRRCIKNQINDLNNDFFKRESIVDLNIKTKGIKLEKKSFMNLEITLFTKNQFDIKENNVKSYIEDITKNIVNTNLIDRDLFNFFKNKK